MLTKTIAQQPENGRAIIALDIPPAIFSVIIEAWNKYPDQARRGIIDRLPWGGLLIRLSDLTHIKALGTCGTDFIRISRAYLDGELTTERRAELINTIQHELTHFYLGHPPLEEPQVKHEIETRRQLIAWGLDASGDHKYLDRVNRLQNRLEGIAQRLNRLDYPARAKPSPRLY